MCKRKGKRRWWKVILWIYFFPFLLIYYFFKLLFYLFVGFALVEEEKPKKKKSNVCDGDCENCPPHYGYRYGRWYYGHHHIEGCERGGNDASGGW